MNTKVQSIPGMPDILPMDAPLWQVFEQKWKQLMGVYGYSEVRFPILEKTSLFKRSIGEVTDIVEKEMFSFEDKGGDAVTMRPEGTAGCVRLCLEHGLLHHQTQKLWYAGPMFRYERPQKGRYRQFHQVGVEALGLAGPDIEVEHILLMNRFWKETGVESALALQINTLGSSTSRARYREQLVHYFSKYVNDLDDDSRRRLHTNPLRILDTKNPALADLIQHAPSSYAALEEACKQHFDAFQQGLSDAGIAYVVNPSIVRGLDYYNRTVYEWVSDKLGAQSAVCAGGRYDGLVAQLGGAETPATGFAMGIERLLLLWKTLEVADSYLPNAVDAYLISVGEKPEQEALIVAEKIRDAMPNLRLMTNCGGGNFKQQFKKADKSGARIALILGEQEWSTQTIGIKYLREERAQTVVALSELGEIMRGFI